MCVASLFRPVIIVLASIRKSFFLLERRVGSKVLADAGSLGSSLADLMACFLALLQQKSRCTLRLWYGLDLHVVTSRIVVAKLRRFSDLTSKKECNVRPESLS